MAQAFVQKIFHERRTNSTIQVPSEDSLIDEEQVKQIIETATKSFFEQEKKRHLALRELYPNKGGEKLYNLKGDAIPTNIFLKGIKADERIEICTNVYNLHQAGLT